MARALSQDLRDRVVAAVGEGMSCRAVAERFGIGVATAVRWRQLSLRHGRAVAGKPGGDQRSSKTDKHADVILALLEDRGDITLAEIRAALAAQGIAVGMGTLHRFFVRHAITRKKRMARPVCKGNFEMF
jgi:transposase